MKDRSNENFGNPFASLKVDNLPPAPEELAKAAKRAEAERKPTREEKMTAALSREDQALLKAFGGADAAGVLSRRTEIAGDTAEEKTEKKRGKLTLVQEKKGHGGKTVTLVHGLKDEEMAVQMEICSAVKTALGTGARFVEGVLEIQGDQRQRAARYFEAQGFTCQIPGK